ncbi:S8 family serine peptidase [Kitasatospora sp. NPDC050543]|uniref:S8 family serine peptidase n=1 Tax=Kitasatospora sp. NPDC050543 TaxID=3364054 RepID=UPI0037A03DC1
MSGINDLAPMADASVTRSRRNTGRFLVLLDTDDMERGLTALHSRAGLASAEHVRGMDASSRAEALSGAGTVVLDDLGVAIVEANPDQRGALRTAVAAVPSLLRVEPERVLYAAPTNDYLRGYQDGVADAIYRVTGPIDGTVGQSGPQRAQAIPAPEWDESRVTWGVQEVLGTETRYTGQQVGVAVLDTGADLNHPDFSSRIAGAESFVPEEVVDDGSPSGHGTHCVGTACGPKVPAGGPRYGVAPEVEIYVGKVLSNQEWGEEGWVLSGIDWAVREKNIKIVSMSLSQPVGPDEAYSVIFEGIARRALRRGTLIVAAAGNESERPLLIAPVGHPANCPSVLAVGAIARDRTIAPFSCAGLNPDGGTIDLVAPGVDVLSASVGGGYRRLSGTSMATPHVAGVAALFWQQKGTNWTAQEIKNLLKSNARPMGLSEPDGGSGLVQAPLG